ncbi:MAG TPA: acyl-ACP thioesterase domain-containing protein [Candidatus Bathyarchaeia archaeon]|nr:acyl-ACP thioesterase domain-containing protein [Candidatus Bathyarchaeia archaeon]
MIEIYEMQVKPRALEINEREEIKATAIIDYLQQIAFEHAFNLGLSFQQTFKKNLTWYLLRYYIEIYDYPKLSDLLTVRTWPVKSESEKYSLRDFQILDQMGKVVCNATTSWILYNFIKRKPVNFMDHFKDIPRKEERAINYNFPNLPLPEKIDSKVELVVRRSDLDLNRHVNNRVYFEWTLETISKKQLEKYKINKIEISYKGQAVHMDTVLVETELNKTAKNNDEIIAISKISKMKSGELLTKVKSYWIKK